MPIYLYQCPTCRQPVEVLARMSDPAPLCHGDNHENGMHRTMVRLPTAPGALNFKGSGFYETDFKAS